jgi:CubicO group peptidase (beta-lactamase class C family)
VIDVVTPEAAGFSSARLRRIGDAMRRFVDEGKIAGAVTLVARPDQIAHFEATGFQDLEARRPMETDAIFRIASAINPVTVVAVMTLFEEGRFLLDDPIAELLPEFAQTKVFARETHDGVEVADLERPITIWHLLMHTSGLTGQLDPNDPVAKIYAREQIVRNDETMAEKVRRLAALPLAHQPGASWTYGMSHDVLARLVEVVSGQPFEDYLQQRIFGPLEMIDTGFVVPPDALNRLAPVYASAGRGGLRRDDNPAHDRSQKTVYPAPSTKLVSTAADYGRFCQMLLNGGAVGGTRLLGRKTVELMTTNHWAGEKSPFPPSWVGQIVQAGHRFGLGVRVLADAAQSTLPCSVGEYSWGGAYATCAWVDPREQLLGLILSQSLVPSGFRRAWAFQTLVYQALVN